MDVSVGSCEDGIAVVEGIFEDAITSIDDGVSISSLVFSILVGVVYFGAKVSTHSVIIDGDAVAWVSTCDVEVIEASVLGSYELLGKVLLDGIEFVMMEIVDDSSEVGRLSGSIVVNSGADVGMIFS